MDFCKILYGGILVKSVNEIQVWLKSKVRGTVHKDLYTFMTALVAIVSVVTIVSPDFPIIIVIKLTNVPIVTFASIVKNVQWLLWVCQHTRSASLCGHFVSYDLSCFQGGLGSKLQCIWNVNPIGGKGVPYLKHLTCCKLS